MTMRIPWLTLLLTASAGLAQAQAPATTRVVVPVVGTVAGMGGVIWITNLELVNDSGSPAVVGLELPAAPDTMSLILELGPGETVRYANVVGEAFGQPSVLSPLTVTTMGRRSVGVRATVYGIRGSEVSPPQPIAIDYAGTTYPFRMLDDLSFSDDYRTNIGLVNLGTENAVFLLGVQRVPGRNIATTQVVVPPGSMIHRGLQSLFPLITHGHRFNVLIETAAPGTLTYASVIDNHDHSARFVSPRPGTQ